MTTQEQQALARLLRERRQELGLSAAEVARRAGIDKATLSWLDQCKVPEPKVKTIRAIAEALEIPLADIYAVVNWLPADPLPSLRPYMRAKYGDLTESELVQIEAFVGSISARHGHGPRPGEDE